MRAVDAARGKWRSILTHLGIDSKLLDGRHHPCPNGGGKDRFRFADRNGSGNFFCDCSDGTKGGMSLLMCCKGLGYAEAAREVERVAGVAREDRTAERKDPRIALNRIHERVGPPSFGVMRYLRERGLTCPPGLLSARLSYWHEGKSLGVYECMVGIITSPKDRPESYHLTYIDGAKKADVPSPRKVMTPINTITGGAIRLYPRAERMGIAEGIETAIAASMLSGMPVWAAVSASGMESFEPPASVRELVVFGDADEGFVGQSAAYALARRVSRSGVRCDVRIPAAGDWADELVRMHAVR